MRKRISILAAVALMILALLACAGCGSGGDLPAQMVGEWSCHETASDGETDTGFYAMYIQEDGTFSLYDTVGNPGIAGKMTLQDGDETNGQVDIKCGTDDFDPPFCWKIEPETTLEYRMEGTDLLSLGHDDIWLTFDRTADEVVE